MEVKDRLRKMLKIYNGYGYPIKQSDFCSKIGVSSGYFSSIRNGLSFDKLRKIIEHYPYFDIKCLITGKATPENEIYQDGGKVIYSYESFIDFDKLIQELEDSKKTIADLKLIIKQQQKNIKELEDMSIK
ncbi:hypothetical protein IR083_16060 [Dysgonomonas sp. GY75]|uniref:hypothetical protein n=1 Tax=Dysgonomonas sp. GY75 TaxID=2780419 RepID=UPI001883A6D4|nr:hypothetical protein [Dysgonomonas sp. GY75]MBF0650342.1 hypothetical protein [Dysgonomonas sp. GY75]